MKKVAIVTLTGYLNYGNRLQNYALQEAIKSLNFEVETIKVKVDEQAKAGIISRINACHSKSFKSILSVIYNTTKNKIFDNLKINKIRVSNFMDFSNKFINETTFWISEHNIPENLNSSYDYFVAGSDQIWNPYLPEVSSIYFLTFVPTEKRIAYAASFGIDKIPDGFIVEYESWLKNFNKLSVREENGAQIINKLIAKKVPVVLDPTLLLSKKQWLDLVDEDLKTPSCKYLLTYFLSPISKDNEDKIKKYAKLNDLLIVNLANFKDKKTYIKGPSDFINYINKCEVLFTDSFHGTVFSIIFEKSFVVLKRNNTNSMYSRIENLLEIFKLKDRELDNIKLNDRIRDIDYTYTRQVLKKQRILSMKYLRDALDVKETQ
jgi:hypothetical protein